MKKYVVLTFYTTAAAMAAERACHSAGVAGRLFSVPRELTADCGIAWRSEAQLRDVLEKILRAENLETEGIYTLEL